MSSSTPRSAASPALLARIRRCDACGAHASAPILRWVDFDAVSLHCEPCAIALDAGFTAQSAIAHAVITVGAHHRMLNRGAR
jgi:hypothetical protein